MIEQKNFSLPAKDDLLSGLVVFLVALPLCLGIAFASGAPLMAGVISGIIGGIVIGSISGSAVSVSGPAAGLAAIVAGAIAQLGYEGFLVAVVLAGLLQITMGLLRLGSIANFFPSSVIKGMLAAIGLLLILKQFPHAIGYDREAFGDDSFLSIFTSENTFTAIATAFRAISLNITLISLVSIGILLAWTLPWAKKLKIVPAPLIVVLIGIAAGQLYEWQVPEWTLRDNHLVSLPSVKGIGDLFANLPRPDWAKLFRQEVLGAGLVLGIVATIESLLSLEAADKLDTYKRISPVNRELLAQGLGNIAAGMLGSIPVTAVIVRSSANIDAGAKTKFSAIFHGVLLAVCVLSIPWLLNMIPLASLACILLVTGYKLAAPKLFKSMYKLGWNQFLPFIITVAAILFTDLLRGVIIGLIASVFFVLRSHYRTPIDVIRKKREDGTQHCMIILSNNISFVNKAKIRQLFGELEELKQGSTVEIDGKDIDYIDYDILEMIAEFCRSAQFKGLELRTRNIPEVDVSSVH